MTMGTALGDSIQVTIISEIYQVDDYIIIQNNPAFSDSPEK